MCTIVNINGTETKWPLTESQVSYIQNVQKSMCNRSYFIEWSTFGKNSRIIYRQLCDLEMCGEIEHVNLFKCRSRYICVFNDHQLGGMAVTCHGVGLFEAWLAGMFPSLPSFRFEHPYAHYSILRKGKQFVEPLN